MTTYVFEYRDEDGDDLIARPMRGIPAVMILTGTNGIAVDLDRVEEVVAGIRDAARQAAGQPAGCVCGQPDTTGVVHRPGAPCYIDEAAAEEPQDHPAAALYFLLRKAGEDRDTAQQLIYAHAAMAVRQHEALNDGDTAAAGQPDTQQQAEPAPVVAYRDPRNPRVLLCRDHGRKWHGVVPLTANDLPDGGICVFGRLSSFECGRDVLADEAAR